MDSFGQKILCDGEMIYIKTQSATTLIFLSVFEEMILLIVILILIVIYFWVIGFDFFERTHLLCIF